MDTDTESESNTVIDEPATPPAEPEDRECPVCQVTEGDLITTACGHHFHLACLMRWNHTSARRGTGNTTCPVCREPMFAQAPRQAAPPPPPLPDLTSIMTMLQMPDLAPIFNWSATVPTTTVRMTSLPAHPSTVIAPSTTAPDQSTTTSTPATAPPLAPTAPAPSASTFMSNMASLFGAIDNINITLDSFAVGTQAVPVDDGEEEEIEEVLDSIMEMLAEEDHAGMREVLVRVPAIAHTRCDDGTTVLHHCVARNDIQATDLLLEYHASARIRSNCGLTPLHMACAVGNVQLAVKLLNAGSFVDATDACGNTPLVYAIRKNDVPTCFALLCRTASVDTANNIGQTPLHVAARGCTNTIVTVLIHLSRNLEQVDSMGNNALHVACESNNVEFARTYMSKAPQMVRFTRNLSGKSPADIAYAGHNVLLHNTFSAQQILDFNGNDNEDEDEVN